LSPAKSLHLAGKFKETRDPPHHSHKSASTRGILFRSHVSRNYMHEADGRVIFEVAPECQQTRASKGIKEDSLVMERLMIGCATCVVPPRVSPLVAALIRPLCKHQKMGSHLLPQSLSQSLSKSCPQGVPNKVRVPFPTTKQAYKKHTWGANRNSNPSNARCHV